MAVIAMTREMGSLGKDVAAGLAERLGLNVVHHELVARHLSERLGTGESTVHRFLEGEASLLERWKVESKRLSRFTAEEILELAVKGNVVIRGWGAASLLRQIPHVLCVRVCAPLQTRVQRMMTRLNWTDPAIARREIERNDAAHASTMQRFFGATWESPELYDIVLNTERVPVAACVDYVQSLAQRPEFQESEQSRSVLQDKLIEVRARGALDNLLGARSGNDLVEVNVDKGHVVVSGFVTDKEMLKRIEGAVRSVPGVARVEMNARHWAGGSPSGWA